MLSRLDLIRHLLENGYDVLSSNIRHLTLAEALFVPPGGYRSVLGTLKHAAGWSHVYWSYAFEPQPINWHQLSWPQGRRDTVVKSQAYLDEVIKWLALSHQRWQASLAGLQDGELDEEHPVQRKTSPLRSATVWFHPGERTVDPAPEGHGVFAH